MKYPSDFSAWSTQVVHTAFDLIRETQLPSLDVWMSKPVQPLSEWDMASLKNALLDIQDRARFWSESDIKMKLIGPALIASKLDNLKFSSFAEVTLRAELTTVHKEKIKVAGRPDIIVAMGQYEAQLPYFCMQEYKRQLKAKGDPQGQMLIELLAARQINLDAGKPLEVMYGAFTIGREWIFATLEGNHYALSRTFLLDVEVDLIEVTNRLRALKYVIAEMLGIQV
jgi:hypothetical protein